MIPESVCKIIAADMAARFALSADQMRVTTGRTLAEARFSLYEMLHLAMDKRNHKK